MRMTNLLDCSLHTVNILIHLCDTIASCVIKEEETAYFMSLICFSILHVMTDVQGLFIGSFFRKLDTDNELLIEVFSDSERMIDENGNLRTPLHNAFLACFFKDGNGNILFKKAVSSGEKHLSFCRFHFTQIRAKLTEL